MEWRIPYDQIWLKLMVLEANSIALFSHTCSLKYLLIRDSKSKETRNIIEIIRLS